MCFAKWRLMNKYYSLVFQFSYGKFASRRISMSATSQSTNVVRHPIEHPTHIQTSMTLPTRPNAIFSTLQGTQNPDTKPTLQRAKNANAQPAHPG